MKGLGFLLCNPKERRIDFGGIYSLYCRSPWYCIEVEADSV